MLLLSKVLMMQQMLFTCFKAKCKHIHFTTITAQVSKCIIKVLIKSLLKITYSKQTSYKSNSYNFFLFPRNKCQTVYNDTQSKKEFKKVLPCDFNHKFSVCDNA